MEDIKQKLRELFESSDWSAEDRNWLLNYLEKNDTSALQQLMQQQFAENVRSGEKLQGDAARQLLERIREKIRSIAGPAKIVRFDTWKKVAAAVIIILLGTGAFFMFSDKKKKEIATTNPVIPIHNDVAPGGNKAILILADGSQIILDSAANGNLASQGNIKVIKLDGQLAYNSAGTTLGDGGEVLYNTITTPRGGQYQLVLADGSKVWLNAASSLRFPATFVGKERKVELTGEGYFEVAKNASMPFKVNVAGKGEVEVLGTHFNINSYTDEATINTTLLEGKVKVSALSNQPTGSGGQPVTSNQQTLSPGQQAKLTPDGQITIDKNVDLSKVIAWKEGLFDFENSDIKTILRQFARWYDIEVIYEKPVVDEKYFGLVNRNSTLLSVLKSLKANAIQFRIEGKKLYIE